MIEHQTLLIFNAIKIVTSKINPIDKEKSSTNDGLLKFSKEILPISNQLLTLLV